MKGSLAAILLLTTTLPLAAAAEEDFGALVGRLQKEKATFANRHRELLAERYDLADRPAKGVTMSRG